ncbi:signal recognition particle subunit SRP72-like [Teratosphaeria destructans]|uniref:Signal recognition particle subunit SRP72 n=1 Tax=Teratosphaeria destructans TaxID=418781 RepID=A0A9W7W2H9_9PEZI|nr:signal recognition particle subunit SRP72-like [Teratosphaeria destructans]
MYNFGCDAIAQGKLGRAEVLLKRSRDLCNKLDSEEERSAEMPPIVVQLVYVLARLGKMEEAESLAKTIKSDGITEKSTKYIAQVNSIASSQAPSNPFLNQRMITKDVDSLKPDYPFRFQASIMKRNSYATDLQALKFAGTADSTADIIAKAAAPTIDAYYNSLSAVNAAAHARSQTGKEALKHILPLLERRPNDVGLILTIVQLYVLIGNSASATNLLERFLDRLEQSGSAAELDVRFAPGLVGALVSLYDAAGRRSQMRSELAKAAMHWRRQSKDRPTGVVHLLKSAGSTLLESEEADHQKLAGEIFRELHQRDESDRYAAAGLLAASSSAPNGSEAASLQPIDSLIAEMDIDSLENAGIAQAPTAPATAASRKRPAEESKPKKPKKIRKSKLPKDYDPNKKPDAERWLPLRDRSTYRPKGKKGKARANLLSQGAAPTPADSDGSRPATPGAASEVVKAKQQQGGGAKKKKKGGKW